MAMAHLTIHLPPIHVHNPPYSLPPQAPMARHPSVFLMATTQHLFICTTSLLARHSTPSSPLSPTRQFVMWLICNSPLSNFISKLVVAQLAYSRGSPFRDTSKGNKESSAARTFKLEDAHVVRCSRERSRAAWKVIEEYLMPFVEQERYKISSGCRLHPDNDLYRDQEQHKHHVDINEWRCGYCRKNFYEEKYLDKHFDNRHFDLLNTSHSRCLADLCGALHCDLVMDSSLRKTKCNPAAAARNKHLCESLADSCFPVSKGLVTGRLHEFFLRQFCDAHTCSGGPKPFPKGQKKRTSMLYISLSILTLMLLPLFYFFIYLYQRGIKSGSQELKRISLSGRKKKSF